MSLALLLLPTELLLLVATFLKSEGDINSLAQTNRQLYSILNRYLYGYNAQNSKSSALLWATDHGQATTARLSIQEGAHVTGVGVYVLPPLLRALRSGDNAIVKLLLETGKVDINGTNPPWGQTPPFRCDVARMIELGEDYLDPADIYKRTPLFRAIETVNKEAVQLLIETGQVDMEPKCSSYGWTPLFMATGSGKEEILKLLIETGQVDINPKDANGYTPLLMATHSGNKEAVKLLLESGQADVNWKEADGLTPLSMAVNSGRKEMVKLLLETGQADINSKDTFGQTPLFNAVNGRSKEVMKLLLATGQADIDSKDIRGYTPLCQAAESGRKEIVEVLLETGQVDVNAKTERGWAPLSLAIKSRNKEVVNLIKAARRVL